MTVHDWLKSAISDAERRELPALTPLLEGIAKSTEALREAAAGALAPDEQERASKSGAGRSHPDR